MKTVAELVARLETAGLAGRGVCADSRQLRSGEIFFAWQGERGDGRAHIAAAIAAGAAAVVWESGDGFDPGALSVPSFGLAGLDALAGPLAATILHQPSRKLLTIGVTGTNGKTSITQMLAQALEATGRRCALIGTLGNGFPGALAASANTTPDAVRLQALLADFVAAGAEAVAMEVSSIGIDQRRVDGVEFDVLVFTNLSRDHLDYHADMATYGACKAALFAAHPAAQAVICSDDEFGLALAQQLAAEKRQLIVYGLDAGRMAGFAPVQQLFVQALTATANGYRFQLCWQGEQADCEVRLIGEFNIANLLALAGVLLAQGVALRALPPLLAGLQPPPGRMQLQGGEQAPLVVVDYAHTPDALAQVLQALRPNAVARGGALVCVFGCGGDRDPGKRPLMGEVAARLADRVILTSDNPRREAPATIIAAIAGGLDEQSRADKLRCIESRAEAIRCAITGAAATDLVLIAGKGHEDYQEVAGVRRPFSDSAQAALALAARTQELPSC